MSVNSDYRKKAKRYLLKLLDMYSRKELVQEDLEDMYDTLGGIDYTKDRITTSVNGSSAESRIANKEREINYLKKEIKAIDRKLDRFEKIKSNLSPIERQVIEYKYLRRKENNISYSYLDIHVKTNYSIPRLKQIHKETLNKIAYILYGESATDK